jgi:peptidoglycan-N-acetylglucosamine deacetylase
MKTIVSFLILFFSIACNTTIENQSTIAVENKKYTPDPNKKYIYLTFDDGPLYGSDKIDSIILEEKIKFNVFLVGKHIYKTAALKDFYTRYTKNPYIKIYNHSFSHANDNYSGYYTNIKNVIDDIQKNESELNIKDKTLRLPGRNIWWINGKTKGDTKSGMDAAAVLGTMGYTTFGWDYEWHYNHKNGRPKESIAQIMSSIRYIFNNKKEFTPNHLVLLAHDGMMNKDEYPKLKQLIDSLKATDYVLATMDQYPLNK